MKTTKQEISLERNEFHQVQVTYSFKVKLGDQDAWDQLLAIAIDAGNIEVGTFTKKASKKPDQWQQLYMLAGERVKEVAERLSDEWLSEIQGTTEVTVSVKDGNDNDICEMISPEY
jgi:hypothetical protein